MSRVISDYPRRDSFRGHSSRVAVIGVPSNSAGKADGVARAPTALRKAGLTEALAAVCDVKDFGDIVFDPHTPDRDPASGLISPDTTTSVIFAVSEAVKKAREEQRFPLVLGGDCPLLLGAVAPFRGLGTNVGIAFIDGHEDAYGPNESPTGEVADMELGLALGLKTGSLPQRLKQLLPLVKPTQVVVLGARDAGTIRREGVASLAGQVEFYNDKDLREGGPDEVGKSALSRLTSKSHSVWLHVDLDVLSTDSLDAVDYPQPGGLTWQELEALTGVFIASPAVVGWDVTIYNPDLDPEGRRAGRIVRFILNTLCARP